MNLILLTLEVSIVMFISGHPDDPYLHFIRTELIQNGKVVDSFRTCFGVRLFEMRGDEGSLSIKSL